jgi:hypothetical protein
MRKTEKKKTTSILNTITFCHFASPLAIILFAVRAVNPTQVGLICMM